MLYWDWKTAQWLRAFVTVPENLNLAPKAHTGLISPVTPTSGGSVPSPGLQENPYKHNIHSHGYTHIKNKKAYSPAIYLCRNFRKLHEEN